MDIFLETDRLILRRFTEQDVDNLFDLDSDPDVMRLISGGPGTPRRCSRTTTSLHYLNYYERFAGYGFWVAIERSTGDFLGWFHLRPMSAPIRKTIPSSGFGLKRSAWGKRWRPKVRKRWLTKPLQTWALSG